MPNTRVMLDLDSLDVQSFDVGGDAGIAGVEQLDPSARTDVCNGCNTYTVRYTDCDNCMPSSYGNYTLCSECTM